MVSSNRSFPLKMDEMVGKSPTGDPRRAASTDWINHKSSRKRQQNYDSGLIVNTDDL